MRSTDGGCTPRALLLVFFVLFATVLPAADATVAAVCVCSENSTSVSRRSSRAAAATRSRHSSITSALLRQGCSSPRKSTDTTASFGGASASIRPSSRHHYLSGNYDVPGIEISRIDTLDFDDGSLLATCSGKHGYGTGSKQSYILLNRCDGNSVTLEWFNCLLPLQ